MGFEQGWEHGDSCGQVIIATQGLHPSLHGTLMLVATVAMAMIVMMVGCDGDEVGVCIAEVEP